MVITTGIGELRSRFWVWALNALQNSMMLRPRWPSAGPIGGDGLAAPAGTCSLRYPVIFFAITLRSDDGGRTTEDGWTPRVSPLADLSSVVRPLFSGFYSFSTWPNS